MTALPAWTTRVRLVLLALVAVVTLFLFVFPTRSWLAQRHRVDKVRDSVETLERQNHELQRQVNRLQTPAQIETIARERLNMVRPGEKSYRVVPAPAPAEAPATNDLATPTTTAARP